MQKCAATTKYRWKASVRVLTTTQALTNLSNVIPGGGPKPETAAAEAISESILDLDTCPVSSSPYFCSMSINSGGDRLYPKLRRASANSLPSMVPE